MESLDAKLGAHWDHEPCRRRGNESLIFSENLASCLIRDSSPRLLRFMDQAGMTKPSS